MPMVVMSGESQTLGEDPELDIEPQWYGGLSVGGVERFVENITKWSRQVTSPYTLYETVIRAGEMAQRTPMGPIYLNVALEHMLHDWSPPANDREVPFAPRRAGASERDRKGRRPVCSSRKIRSSSPSIRAATRRPSRRSSSSPIYSHCR